MSYTKASQNEEGLEIFATGVAISINSTLYGDAILFSSDAAISAMYRASRDQLMGRGLLTHSLALPWENEGEVYMQHKEKP